MKVSSIVGYEGKYDITSDGDIISLNYNNTGKQQKLKYRLNKKGRPYINLCINGKYKSYEIHRLVAEAFIPKIEGKEQVNHIDGNKQNNSIKNLEWVTRDENMQHASINGLLPTEFSTVTVTRRFFKNGDSEYRLNDVSCRLKDIHNLFMDTGVSTDSYAIIELGMVDDIIKDKENSRRRMLEQAAGITIYKTRKKEAATS